MFFVTKISYSVLYFSLLIHARHLSSTSSFVTYLAIIASSIVNKNIEAFDFKLTLVQ